MTLATLSDAIDWARDRWAGQRAVPLRLHAGEVESHSLTTDLGGCTCMSCTRSAHEGGTGALAFTASFSSALEGINHAKTDAPRTVACYHPTLRIGARVQDCPECDGHGVKEVTTTVFQYPMTLALNRLRNAVYNRRQPHPYGLIVVLAAHGWRAQEAAAALAIPWDRAEPLFIMALRKLHAKYQEAPLNTRPTTTYAGGSGSWVDLSDAQRNAIEAGETAA